MFSKQQIPSGRSLKYQGCEQRTSKDGTVAARYSGRSRNLYQYTFFKIHIKILYISIYMR